MFKKLDISIITIVAVFGLLLSVFNFSNIFKEKYQGNRVLNVYIDGKLDKTFSFSKEFFKNYEINSKFGYNILEIKNGEAYIKDADCQSKLCVISGKIDNVGEFIICLPHKLVVKIEGESELDAVSY